MLTKLSFRSFDLAHISLTLVGLMWVLPFLYYRHAYPLTTFYQEWGAAVLGLCAMPLLMSGRYWQEAAVPRIVLLPLGMMLLLLVQYLLGKVASYEQTLLLCLYFLWIALLFMLGQRLRIELGLPRVSTVLAVFLVLGAELNALAGVIQHYRWHTFLDSVVTVQVAAAVYGNIAQPNHFADYVTLGLVSIGMLYGLKSLRVWHVVLLALPLLFVLALSGSRSTWLYLLFVVGVSYFWQRRDPVYLPLLKYALSLLLGFFVMIFVVQTPWLAGASESAATVQRMFADGTSGSIRLYLWHESWLIFTRFPLLGAGFGQFAWQHFQLAPDLQNGAISGLYNNAHNVVLQLAAETGLLGLSIVTGILGLSLWRAWREPRTLHRWWAFCLLAVLGIHGLLEYPLWYAHFIGIAAIVLGMMDVRDYRLELRLPGRLSLAVLLLLCVLALAQLFQGYRKLDAALALRPLSGEDRSYAARQNAGLAEVYRYALLRPYAELFMSGSMETSADRLEGKLALNERIMRFVPVSSVVYRQAWLLALSGHPAEAKEQLRCALWSYPAEFQGEQSELNYLALKDPAHFSALLEFAIQKNEEYRSAVLGK